jgi:membrane protein DedA with SNARE-associated domain
MKAVSPIFFRVALGIVVLAIVAGAIYAYQTLEPDVETLERLIRQYGYGVLLTLVFLGNLGLPVPEETTTLLSGIAVRKGWLSYPIVWSICVGAAIIGDNAGYWIGHTGGRRLLLHFGPLVGVTPERFVRFQAFFDKHGAKTVFFARFVGGLRFAAGPMSGAARMPFRKFFFFNALGALVWVSAMTSLGYFFGLAVLGALSNAGWAILLALGVIVGVVYLIRRKRRSPAPSSGN